MNGTSLVVASSLAVVMSAAAWGISAAVDMPSTLMSPADYKVAKRAIEGESRLAYAKCRLHRESPREVCRAEARAAERVKVADLDARYYGTISAAEEARLTRLRAGYELARARCGAKDEVLRPECMRTARDENARALANAKLAAN